MAQKESAENRRRVLRRMSRTAFSADAFLAMDSLSSRSLEPSLSSAPLSVQTRLTAHSNTRGPSQLPGSAKALDVGTKEEGESTQRGLAANGSENSL